MPESYNQAGTQDEKNRDTPDTADKFFLILKEENGSFKDITGTLTQEEEKTVKIIFSGKRTMRNQDGMAASRMLTFSSRCDYKIYRAYYAGYEKYTGQEFAKRFLEHLQMNRILTLPWHKIYSRSIR
jgi:hypothetical protein